MSNQPKVNESLGKKIEFQSIKKKTFFKHKQQDFLNQINQLQVKQLPRVIEGKFFQNNYSNIKFCQNHKTKSIHWMGKK